jgi:protein-tyrosine phosphatase
VADFNFVTSRLATGAAISSADDVQALVDAGVTHVVNCVPGEDDNALFAAHPKIHVLYNPTEDDGQHKPPEWFFKSIYFAMEGLSHHKRKVYAHCAAGVNRGPSTCFAIMLALGWTAESAEATIRAARPQVGLAYKQDAETALATWL